MHSVLGFGRIVSINKILLFGSWLTTSLRNSINGFDRKKKTEQSNHKHNCDNTHFESKVRFASDTSSFMGCIKQTNKKVRHQLLHNSYDMERAVCKSDKCTHSVFQKAQLAQCFRQFLLNKSLC